MYLVRLRLNSIFVTCVCVLASSSVRAAEATNKHHESEWIMSDKVEEGLFFTGDGVGLLGAESVNVFLIHQKKLEETRHLSECKPASQDPAGNWGAREAGFQLSIRFERNRYTSVDPIPAAVIMRNVAEKSNDWSLDRGIPPENVFFELEGPRGKQSSDVTARSIITRSPGLIFAKRIQRKYVVRLDKIFRLTSPGSYKIRCWTEVIDKESKPSRALRLYSGQALFEVVLPPHAAKGAARTVVTNAPSR